MSFLEKVHADNKKVFFADDVFEEDLVYNGGTIKGIVVVLALHSTEQGESQANPGMAEMAEIYVSSENFSVPPSVRESIIQGSKTWSVEEVIDQLGVYKLICSANRRIRRHR